MFFLWQDTGSGTKADCRTGVYICEQCVDLCNEIIEDELESGNLSYDNGTEINLLKPKEMKEFWMSM